MSCISMFIQGEPACSSINWAEKVFNGELNGVVSQISKNNTKQWRIDFEDNPSESLLGVSTLIVQLYDQNHSKFDLVNFKCKEEGWKQFFKHINAKVTEERSVDLNVTVDLDDSPFMNALVDDLSGSYEGTIYIYLFPAPKKEAVNSNLTSSIVNFRQIPTSVFLSTELKLPTPPSIRHLSFVIPTALGKRPQSSNEFNPEKELTERLLKLLEKDGSFKNELGTYKLTSNDDDDDQGGRACVITLNSEVSKNMLLLKKIIIALEDSYVDDLTIKNMPLNKGEESQNFVTTLINNAGFTTLRFESCEISSATFESLSKVENQEIIFFEIKGMAKNEKGVWIEFLPALIQNYPSLASFICDDEVVVESLDFLNRVFLFSLELVTLSLKGLRCKNELLLEWLCQEKHISKDSSNGSTIFPLSLLLGADFKDYTDEEKTVFNELLSGVNKQYKKVLKITIK